MLLLGSSRHSAWDGGWKVISLRSAEGGKKETPRKIWLSDFVKVWVSLRRNEEPGTWAGGLEFVRPPSGPFLPLTHTEYTARLLVPVSRWGFSVVSENVKVHFHCYHFNKAKSLPLYRQAFMNLVLQAQMAGCLSFKMFPLSFLLPTAPLNVCLVTKVKNR